MIRYKLETADSVRSVIDEYPETVFWVRYSDIGIWREDVSVVAGWNPSYLVYKAHWGDIEVELPEGVEL